jgi:hypothetical protein
MAMSVELTKVHTTCKRVREMCENETLSKLGFQSLFNRLRILSKCHRISYFEHRTCGH